VAVLFRAGAALFPIAAVLFPAASARFTVAAFLFRSGAKVFRITAIRNTSAATFNTLAPVGSPTNGRNNIMREGKLTKQLPTESERTRDKSGKRPKQTPKLSRL